MSRWPNQIAAAWGRVMPEACFQHDDARRAAPATNLLAIRARFEIITHDIAISCVSNIYHAGVSFLGALLMAFRADEAALSGYERAKKHLIPVTFSPEVRATSEKALLEIIDELGPVVDSYPTWHPIVSKHSGRNPETTPSERTGYLGLDHTWYFAHGFITCPYGGVEKVIQSAISIDHHCATITAEELDIPFYNVGAKPILVRCEWSETLNIGKQIPKKLAVPLMLEQELPMWRWSSRAERWDVMRPYLLGQPHGSRSSLFVDQETAIAMKRAYMAMVESGMFGPLKMN
jgi:hypothetical protein